MTYKPASLVSNNQNATSNQSIQLPNNTVLGSQYDVLITANLALRRTSDHKIVWEGKFNGEQVYQAPQVGAAVINTVDPIYNHSALKTVVEQIALDMMNDAHDRMTENF
jgi:hypothetical protein